MTDSAVTLPSSATAVTQIAAGSVALVAGVAALVVQNSSLAAVAGTGGAFMALTGLCFLVSAVFGSRMNPWGRGGAVALAFVYLIFGLIVLTNVYENSPLLLWFVLVPGGIAWAMQGIAALAWAAHSPAKGLQIGFGVVAIVAGAALFFSIFSVTFPSTVALWVCLLAVGALQLAWGLAMRKSTHS